MTTFSFSFLLVRFISLVYMKFIWSNRSAAMQTFSGPLALIHWENPWDFHRKSKWKIKRDLSYYDVMDRLIQCSERSTAKAWVDPVHCWCKIKRPRQLDSLGVHFLSWKDSCNHWIEVVCSEFWGHYAM